jgi:AAA15 family ATPase/GTPase
MQLESLKIQNFRAFDYLEINNFSKINVLLGENNSGKTSVLESIFLLSGMSNPELSVEINAMRGMAIHKNVFKYIFHNLETKNKPVITGDFSEGSSRRLEIAPVFEKSAFNREIAARDSALSTISLTSVPDIQGLEYYFTVKRAYGQEKFCRTRFHLERNEIRKFQGSDYKEDIISTFLYSKAVDLGLSEQLKRLFVAKREHLLNSLLGKFDDKIKGIYVLSDGIYIDKEGIPERIPLSLMGDGLRRLINIAATIAANDEQNFICLIDEIENGLHYRSQALMWQMLFSLTRAINIQLFVTTHSREMLQSLIAVLKQAEFADMQDLIKVFSIVNTKNAGFQSYARSYDGLDLALEHVMEIR